MAARVSKALAPRFLLTSRGRHMHGVAFRIAFA
jgi:hypothetical protein